MRREDLDGKERARVTKVVVEWVTKALTSATLVGGWKSAQEKVENTSVQAFTDLLRPDQLYSLAIIAAEYSVSTHFAWLFPCSYLASLSHSLHPLIASIVSGSSSYAAMSGSRPRRNIGEGNELSSELPVDGVEGDPHRLGTRSSSVIVA